MKDIIDIQYGVRLAIGALLVAALSFGCVPQGPTDPNGGDIVINNNTTNTNNNGQGQGGGNGASPSPGTCGPVTEVTNGLLGTGGVKNASLRVGQSVPLDTTPNRNADEHCNAFRPVRWAVTQSTVVCEINNPESYTPVVTAKAPGVCVIRASIAGVSATEPITVSVSN